MFEIDIYKSLGLKIKELRLKKGLTQVQLSNQLGFTQATLARYEAGQKRMSVDNLKVIAHFFDVSMDDLLDTKFAKNENKSIQERVVDLICNYNLTDDEYIKLVDYLEFIVLKREKDSENLKKGLDVTLFELKEKQYEVIEEQEEQTNVRLNDEKIR